MIRSTLGFVLLIGALIGIWELERFRTDANVRSNAPATAKAERAERVVYYVMTSTSGPAFHLDGQELELRVVSHLVLAPDVAYSPERAYTYGIRLRIDAPDGETIWRREVYTTTRQSKADLAAGVWLEENAFSLESDVEITDDRVHRITLPEGLPWGSRLHVRLEADDLASHGIVRIYERTEDESLGPALTYFGPSPSHERRLVGRLTYLPWNALTEHQRWGRLHLRWNRMSAVGEAGRDYDTETIFFTGFRASPPEPQPPEPVVLTPDRATALTVWGPGTLRLAVEPECDAQRAWLEVFDVRPSGLAESRSLELCPEPEFSEIGLDAGAHSLHLRVRGSALTAIRAWFEAEDAPPLDEPGFEFGPPVFPEIARSSRYRLSAGGVPATFELGAPLDFESTILRVEAAPVVRAGRPSSGSFELHYAFVDGNGATLVEGTWPIPPTELDAYEIGVDRDDRLWRVHEPVRARFIAPRAARRLRLSARGDVAVAVSTYWPTPDDRSRDIGVYDDQLLSRARWRQAPIAHSSWFRIDAQNDELLEREGQLVDLEGPIRLEPHVPLDGVDPPEAPAESAEGWQVVVPDDPPEVRTVFERLRPGSSRARYSRIRTGKHWLEITDDAPVELLFFVRGDLAQTLGQPLRLVVDGRDVSRRLLTSRGTWELPPLARGRHELEVELPSGGVDLYVDRPTAGRIGRQPESFGVTTLYRLDAEGLQVSIDKPGPEPTYVNAVLYRCGPPKPVTLRIALDDGSPQRVAGVPLEQFTDAERTRRLPAAGDPTQLVFLDRKTERCDIVARTAIPLGSDIAPGPHRIGLRVDGGPSLWARFFARGEGDGSASEPRSWSERIVFDPPSEQDSDFGDEP